MLVDEVLPEQPVRQWVLSFPFQLRFLFASRPKIMGLAARAHERKKLERLCRYILRPAVSEKRLSLTPNGTVRCELKTPYRDGTTHVIFEPLDFIARPAAPVPRPRVNLTRFHGVFAPNSKHRALVTPAKRGRGNEARVADEPPTPAQRRASMTWAQRLKRVFTI